ncbi:uncharacterized protein LOC134217794 [Armigeres subalbatus]|uniref:uncharacterized protein LOC134217794 n=1 Tax=Armigeres subalbatus TaxID=124917 RepID=UPI002ED11DAA
MKTFVAVIALIAAAAADASVQQPSLVLEPPVEDQTTKHSSAVWTEDNSLASEENEEQAIEYVHQESYYAPVTHENAFSDSCHQDYQQENQQYYYQGQSYLPEPTHYSTNDVSPAVAVDVTHPNWATSYSNIGRYNSEWSATPITVAADQYEHAAPVLAVPAPFSKPTQAQNSAPVTDYSHNAAKWNTWSNQPTRDITKVPETVAKYIAITPGSVHIAPLPGHTVSHKAINVAPAASW